MYMVELLVYVLRNVPFSYVTGTVVMEGLILGKKTKRIYQVYRMGGRKTV